MSGDTVAEAGRAVPDRYSPRMPDVRRKGHALRLFFFNAVLFLVLGAFAGFEMDDFLPDAGKVAVLAFVLPLALAVVATWWHLKQGRWTNADDMSERMVHPGRDPHSGRKA